MITPIFSLTQTPENIILKIRLPYVKISSSEIVVEKRNIKFHLHPYFLSLIFEKDLKPDGVQSAIFDHNTSYLTITLQKLISVEEFPNLDLITSILQSIKKPKTQKLPPLIEIIGEESNVKDIPEQNHDVNSIHLTNESSKHELNFLEDFSKLNLKNFSYGFNSAFSKVFVDLKVFLKRRDF